MLRRYLVINLSVFFTLRRVVRNLIICCVTWGLRARSEVAGRQIRMNCMFLDAAKKPRDFTRLTQDYGIGYMTLISFTFYILLRHNRKL